MKKCFMEERIVGILKGTEAGLEQVKKVISEYIEISYNRIRKQSCLRCLSPPLSLNIAMSNPEPLEPLGLLFMA